MISSLKYHIIGLMSGISLDGLDVALCEFSSLDNWQYISGITVAFPDNLGLSLKKIATSDAFTFSKISHEFSVFCARVINDFKQSISIDIDAVASHGHTVFTNQIMDLPYKSDLVQLFQLLQTYQQFATFDKGM